MRPWRLPFLPLALILTAPSGGWGRPAEAVSPQLVIRTAVGVTRLLDYPALRVGYRLDGENREWLLGTGWEGVDPDTGVQFRPDDRLAGRLSWFMHCPWRKGPGVAFADFGVALPEAKPLQLVLAIGLRANAPHSDGVDYRVTINGDEVFVRHCDWKGLHEFHVDVSQWAGKQVILRLAVDPGPARNTKDDWALWGKVDVEAGTPRQVAEAQAARKRRLEQRRRQEFARATALTERSLAPVSGPEARTVRPSCFTRVSNRTQRVENGWRFFARDNRDEVVFELQPAQGVLAGLVVRFQGKPLVPPLFAGAVLPLRGAGVSQKLHLLAAVETGNHEIECRYAPTGTSKPVLTVGWRMAGKSLRMELSAPAGLFRGISLRTWGAVPVSAPFGPAVAYREAEGVYASIAGDLWHSNASQIGSRGSVYSRLTTGVYNPLHDVFYFTVSSRYEETLPNSPYPPSPFLADLAHRVILDWWGGTFADDAEQLRRLARYGVTHALVIKHVWQRDGYDRTYPNVLPANAKQGGDAGLRELAHVAEALGHRFCVHENYYDYYPNAEDFRKADVALNADGAMQKGYQAGPVKAWFLKPARLMTYVRRFSPEIRRRYGCNAAYHDIMPTAHIDYDGHVPGAGMIRSTHQVTRELVEYDHELYGGPVLFEGLSTAMAGLYDGGTSGPLAEENLPLAVGPELLKVHPKQSNHGMSYYERWLEWGYGPGWGAYVMTNRERDHYRAMTVAFGRTGFIGRQLRRTEHGLVREYYLFQAFGRAYTGRRVTHLRYAGDDPGVWLDAGAAARWNKLQRLWVTYEGGQDVYVNLASADWRIAGHTLPPYGSLTKGPRAEAWTARIDGQIADFVRFDNTIYADARSHWWRPQEDPHPILAKVASFADLGHGRFRVTVVWEPEHAIQRDLLVFWHFRTSSGIRFQNDHRPPIPTNRWRPGTRIIDGPATLTVPTGNDSRYSLVVGLYDKQGREPLYGDATELLLGALVVARSPDGHIRQVRFSPVERRLARGADPAPYARDGNTRRQVLDFGPVAANGALVLNREEDDLVLTPVPLGEVFDVGLPGTLTRVIAEDSRGHRLAEVPLQRRGGKTWFRTTPASAYRFRLVRAQTRTD